MNDQSVRLRVCFSLMTLDMHIIFVCLLVKEVFFCSLVPVVAHNQDGSVIHHFYVQFLTYLTSHTEFKCMVWAIGTCTNHFEIVQQFDFL